MQFITTKFVSNLFILSTAGLLFTSNHLQEAQATFNDLQAVNNNIASSAVLDIETSPLSQVFNVSNLVPGDTISRNVTVMNKGSVSFTYEIENAIQAELQTKLWTDKTNGLQLKITDTTGTAVVYYDGPISDLNNNTNPEFNLAPSSNHTLNFLITFPTSADNTFQNLSENITFNFNATQLSGTTR